MEYLFLFFFVLYIAPWVAAESIEHRSANAILFLNLGFGWTGVGWLAAAGWVYRDWPRETSPPNLVVVQAGSTPQTPRWRRASGPFFAALLLVGAVAGTLALFTTDGAPTWKFAKVGRVGASVHLGAGRDWPTVGRLDEACRLRVLDRDGSWLKVWRLDGCDAGMAGRSGWVPVDALRPAPETPR